MALQTWIPPQRKEPSTKHKGESDIETLHIAVGRALSRWEHMESAFIKLFQLMCETPTLGACKAYSTIISATGRSGALRAAASVFFKDRDKADFDPVDTLLKAYANAAAYRNNIAHGIVAGMHGLNEPQTGYYLTTPSYGRQFPNAPNADELWWLSARYFYRVKEIYHCTERFDEMLKEGMTVVTDLNKKYSILKPEQFHP